MSTILEQEIAKIPERVARGIDAQVKEYGFKFFNIIDLDSLDLGSCTECIIGQTAGSYFNYVDDRHIRLDERIDCGFTAFPIMTTPDKLSYNASLKGERKKQITMWRERLKEIEDVDESIQIPINVPKETVEVRGD